MTKKEYYKQKDEINKNKKLSFIEKYNTKLNLWFTYVYGDLKPNSEEFKKFEKC